MALAFFSIEPKFFSVSYRQQTGIDYYEFSTKSEGGVWDVRSRIPGAGDFRVHEDSLQGDIIGAEGG